jgi:adenosylmethionine-8-amino-7-oxononanoate aminotransferase
VHSIEQQLNQELVAYREHPTVTDVRVLGAIGVVELDQAVDVAKAQKEFVARGVWLRPFGRLVYLMPPYIIQPDELSQLTDAIGFFLQRN